MKDVVNNITPPFRGNAVRITKITHPLSPLLFVREGETGVEFIRIIYNAANLTTMRLEPVLKMSKLYELDLISFYNRNFWVLKINFASASLQRRKRITKKEKGFSPSKIS